MNQYLQWRFARFIAVGFLSAGVDTIVVWALVRQGASAAPAVTVGFLVGFAFNYVLHARYTFSVSHRSFRQLVRFVCVVIANYVLTLAVVFLLHDLLAISIVLAKIASLPLVAANGYWLSRKWVFVVA